MDNLHKHNITIVNGCLMCLHDAETVDHLLLRCEVAQFLWNSILPWFDCSWVSHNSMGAFYHTWLLGVGSAKGRVMWKASFLVLIWTIWKERNSRCFEGVSSPKETLAYRVKFFVASRVSVLPNFRGHSIDSMLRCWREMTFSSPFSP